MENSTINPDSIAERLSTVFNDNEKLKEECRLLSSEIESGSIKLCSLVESLGSYLTSKDAGTRERGVAALSLVLESVPKGLLSDAELRYLSSFYADRLKDHHSVVPQALNGMLSLVQMTNFPEDSPKLLLDALFKHVHCQSLMVNERRRVFLTIKSLMGSHTESLKSMGVDFVYGFISSIDGERDPRNLILLFGLIPDFLEKFKLGHLTEEMFEVVACYFPVDFNPANRDNAEITREILAQSLEKCLYSSPDFGEFCIPLVLEKLDSSLKTAKLDSLSLLRSGARVFGPAQMENHMSDLWLAVKREVLPGSDSDVREDCLKTFAEVLRGSFDNSGARDNFIEVILTDVKYMLFDSKHDLHKSAWKLIEHVCQTDFETFSSVSSDIVPKYLESYATKETHTEKLEIIRGLDVLLKVACESKFNLQDLLESLQCNLPEMYQRELSGISQLRNSTESSELDEWRSVVYAGTGYLARYYPIDRRNEIYELILNNDFLNLKVETKDGLNCLMSFVAAWGTEWCTNRNFNFEVKNCEAVEQILRLLEALRETAKLKWDKELASTILSVLLIDNSCLKIAVLASLSEILNVQKDSSVFEELNVLEKLFAVNAIDCFDEMSIVTSKVVKAMPKLYQNSDLVMSVLQKVLFVDDQGNPLISSQKDFEYFFSEITKEPLVENVIKKFTGVNVCHQTDKIAFLEGLIVPQPTIVPQTYSKLIVYFRALIDISTSIDNNHSVQLYSCKIIATYLNKMNDPDCLAKVLNILETSVKVLLRDDKTAEFGIGLKTWITKALCASGSSFANEYLNSLINLLKEENIGELAAYAFHLIIEQDDVLTFENNCTVRFLYRQKIFESVVGHSEEFLTGKDRENYLIAICGMLSKIPVQLFTMHLPKLTPFLIKALDLDNAHLLHSTLATFKILMKQKSEIFTDKISYFVSRFLALSSHRDMKVRIEALNCLALYRPYPTPLVLPFKEEVLEGLLGPIDDPKRLVRKSAVHARINWYLIDSTVEPT